MARRQITLPKARSGGAEGGITEDLMIIKMRPGNGHDLQPGQYCTLGLEGIERAYSIVSAPHEEDLEIFVELVPEPDGALTPLMWKMKEGDTMTIRAQVQGHLYLGRKVQLPPYDSHCNRRGALCEHTEELLPPRKARATASTCWKGPATWTNSSMIKSSRRWRPAIRTP